MRPLSIPPEVKRQPTHLILTFIGLLLVVPLLAYGVIFLEGPRIRQQALDDLAAIGQLKAKQLESWLDERLDDAEMLTASAGLVADAERWFAHRDPEAEARIASRIADLRRVRGYRVDLLDARAPADSLAPARRLPLAEALAAGQPRLGELYRDTGDTVWLDVLAPLGKPTRAGAAPVGAVALSIKADDFLFPLIQTWPTPSPSGETLLIRRDGDSILFLNDLRHRADTALILRLPLASADLPAAIALRAGGLPQTMEGRDYRGVRVLAATLAIPRTSWLLVTKMDRAEVLRPLYTLVTWVGSIAVLAIGVVATILLRLWRQQQRSHRLELLARTGERDRLLSQFYDLPFMGMAIIDPADGHWLHVNDRQCEILGYSHEELAATTWERLTPPEELPARQAAYRRMLAGETDGYEMEQRFLRKDGGCVDAVLTVKCVRRADGSVEYIVETMRDISAQKQAEQELQRLNRTLHAYSASGWALVHAVDESAYLHEFCRIVVEDCGHAMVWIGQAEEDAERSIRPLAHAGLDDGYIDSLRLTWADSERGRGPTGTAIRTGQAVICHDMRDDPAFLPWREEALRRGYASAIALPMSVDGKTFASLNIYSRLPESFGDSEVRLLRKLADELAYGIGVLRLRGERAARDAALRVSEARFRLLASATFEGIAITEQGRFVDANEQLLRMLGFAREELLGMTVAELLPDEDRERVLDNIRHSRESHIEHDMLRKDGSRIQVEAHGQTQIGEGSPFRITALRDISARRRADEALRYQLDLTRGITEKSTDSIFIIDAEGRITAANPEAERMFGYRADEMLGRELHDLIHHHHPDGTPYPSDECPLWRIYATGETVRDHELVVFRKDGGQRVVTGSNAALESGGGIVGAAVVLHDITAIRQAERALRDADQRKDEFLAMLAHELRNPLSPIRNAAHVLGRLELDEPRVRWARDIIERQVTHLTHLVDELLDVSRIASGKISLRTTRIELADLIRQACEAAQPLMTAKRQRFELRLPETPLVLDGDLVRLVQVLQNLLNNAAKYTPDGGRIELSAGQRGREIEIQVRDDGMGMPADLLPRVFDLFRQGERTLDRAQGGLGIGLTLVRRLVELHGGRVEAQSAGLGLGATFTVWLPAADDVDGERPPIDSRADAAVAPLRVLVVDDDPAVAESMLIFLQLEGHQARHAASGEAALALLPAFRPQVVLLDIGLPGQDGYEVARRLRQQPDGAELILVAVSGYGDEAAMARGRAAGFDHYLVKPVAPERLCALLAQCHRLARGAPGEEPSAGIATPTDHRT